VRTDDGTGAVRVAAVCAASGRWETASRKRPATQMLVRLNIAASRSFRRMDGSFADEAKIEDPIRTVDTDLTSDKRFSVAYSRCFNTPFKGRSE